MDYKNKSLHYNNIVNLRSKNSGSFRADFLFEFYDFAESSFAAFLVWEEHFGRKICEKPQSYALYSRLIVRNRKLRVLWTSVITCNNESST